MQTQTQLRTGQITPNSNISFPIGTILSVQEYFNKLQLFRIFGAHKRKGRDINAMISALVSYKLTENLSICKANIWINRPEVLEVFNLDKLEERTLFRILEIIGKNNEEIIAGIQDCVFEQYDFEHTDINMDWTSLVLYGDKCILGKHGFSRDHRPDKKQITVGITELASPINVPVGLTVREGNINDVTHFTDTYNQIRERLRIGSRVIFDKGAHSKENVDMILLDKMKYITSKKLNLSDDKRIKFFKKSKAELIDDVDGIYGMKYYKPSRIDYFLFSEKLKKDQLESKKRKALQMYEEARIIQDSLDNNRGLPRRYRINNVLVDITYEYQTKLKKLSEEEALVLVNAAAINGREGFFCLVSSEDLTLKQALETYRKKDSIEKIMNSLKNEIQIKPLRVWSEDGINGALILGFIAQLIISLMRYDHPELKHISTKFIRKSMMNLTVTVEFIIPRRKRYIFSNFDPIIGVILAQNPSIS
jgi:transposase